MSEASQEVLSSGPADYLHPGGREVRGQLWLMKEWLVFQPAPPEAAMGMQNVSLALSTVDFVGRGEFDVGRVFQTGLKTPIRVVAAGQDYQFAVDNVDTWVSQVAAQVRAVKGEPQPAPYQPGAAAPAPPVPQAPVPPASPSEGPPVPPAEQAGVVPPSPPVPQAPVPPPPVPQAPVPPSPPEAPPVAPPPAPPEAGVPPAPPEAVPAGPELPAEEVVEKKRQFVIAPPPSEPLIPEPPAVPEDLRAAVQEAEAPAAEAEEAPAEEAPAAEAPAEAPAEEAAAAEAPAEAPAEEAAEAPAEAAAEAEAPAPAAEEPPAAEEAAEAAKAPAEEAEAPAAEAEEAPAEEAAAAEAPAEAPAEEAAEAPAEAAAEAEAPAPAAEEAAEEAPAELKIVGISHTYYEVADVLSASSFYENVLGLEVEGQKSVQVVWLKVGDSRFAIRQSVGPGQRGAILALEVEDIQQAREALRQRGGFPEDIVSGPDGERYFCVYDKDRNRIAIWERPKG